MNTGQILLLVLPIAILELALLGLAIRDLLKDERHVRGGNKALWALVIVFISLLGPIVYFVIGREDV
jgi:Phospholipase_D-nuclease N-terminal